MPEEYHDFIDSYDRYYFQRRADELQKVLKDKSVKILDAGCGTGNFLKFLNDLGYKNTFGIDMNKKLIKHANFQCPDSKIGIGDVTKTNFKDSSFDYVLLIDVIEHLPNYKLAMDEAHRLLKDGGVLFITYPNPNLVPLFNLLGDIGLRVYAKDNKLPLNEVIGKTRGKFKVKTLKSSMLISKMPSLILKFFEKVEPVLGQWVMRKVGFFHTLVLEKA